MNVKINAVTVSQLNASLKQLLDSQEGLSEICIVGELSNYKIYPSGHHYFTLKDKESSLKCVMFRNSAVRLRFQPKDGMMVYALGRVTVYPRDGCYQLYCEALMPDGSGDLMAQFEEIKDRLGKKGYFDPARKKPLPEYPKEICVITSPAGAVIHDILRILRKRYPLAEVTLIPVRVQGEEASSEIAGAIALANALKLGDLLIVGRGGGSMEDLWCFNSEKLADAIFASEIPVISAVGHEPDYTICDFVADLRAATPTHGAELAVPDSNLLQKKIANFRSSLLQEMSSALRLSKLRLERLSASPYLKDPMRILEDYSLRLDSCQQKFSQALSRYFEQKERILELSAARLDSMSPLKVLSRGYSYATGEDQKIISSVRALAPGQKIRIRFEDGSARAEIKDISEVSHESV